MRPMLQQDELHRLWIHVPELSDFHLEFDISAAKGFKRSEVSFRQTPQFDLTRVTDLIMQGLKVDPNGFTGFNPEVFKEENNPNFFAVHFDLSGGLFLWFFR
jgi:hypothetical protein